MFHLTFRYFLWMSLANMLSNTFVIFWNDRRRHLQYIFPRNYVFKCLHFLGLALEISTFTRKILSQFHFAPFIYGNDIDLMSQPVRVAMCTVGNQHSIMSIFMWSYQPCLITHNNTNLTNVPIKLHLVTSVCLHNIPCHYLQVKVHQIYQKSAVCSIRSRLL